MSRMRIQDKDIHNADIFEILLDNFPDIIHSISDEGKIVYANKTAERLLGYSREDLVGMHIRKLYATEIWKDVDGGFSDLRKHGDKSVESVVLTKDGARIPVEIRSFGIYDDDGRFIRTFSILRDIREIKDIQRSLAHAGRLAAIGELASGVAHDIHNPLTVVMLSNEMIIKTLSRVEGDACEHLQKIESFAGDIEKASSSIRNLADHLRNFSRGMEERYRPLDIHKSIEDALFITRNKLQSAGVTVETGVKPNRHFISGCPNHIEQVFVNLITNACDAMRDREERRLTITISKRRRKKKDHWLCKVSDTGPGIPAENVENIFRSFFTTKDEGKGTGLGLSITRGIVRDHRGDITVESGPNGATFSVIFPAIEKA